MTCEIFDWRLQHLYIGKYLGSELRYVCLNVTMRTISDKELFSNILIKSAVWIKQNSIAYSRFQIDVHN